MARRRVDSALELMNGDYLKLVTGEVVLRSYSRASRGKPRGAVGAGSSSSLPETGEEWFTDPQTDAGRETVTRTWPRYLDTGQAGEYLGISPSTLNRMRVTGEGPRYSKAGRRVIYDIEDLDAWVEERKRRFTGETVDA